MGCGLHTSKHSTGKVEGGRGPQPRSSRLSEKTLSQRMKAKRSRVRNWAPYLCMCTCEVPHNMHKSTGTNAIKITLKGILHLPVHACAGPVGRTLEQTTVIIKAQSCLWFVSWQMLNRLRSTYFTNAELGAKLNFFFFCRRLLPRGTWSNQPHSEIHISSDTQLQIMLPPSHPTLTLKNLRV